MSTVAPAPPAANAIMSHPTNKHSPLVFAQRVKNRELKKLCVALAKSTPLSSSTSRPPLPKLTFRLNTQGQHVNNPQGGFDKSDEVLLRMMPYLLEGATAEVTISLDPFVAFPLAVFLEQQGLAIDRTPTADWRAGAGGAGAVLVMVPSGPDYGTLVEECVSVSTMKTDADVAGVVEKILANNIAAGRSAKL